MSNLPHVHATFTLAAARLIASVRRGCRFVHLERVLPELRNRPVLLISGKRDNYVAPKIAQHLHENINSEKTELWLVPKARHNQARETAQEEYDGRIVALFSRMDGASLKVASHEKERRVLNADADSAAIIQDGSLTG